MKMLKWITKNSVVRVCKFMSFAAFVENGFSYGNRMNYIAAGPTYCLKHKSMSLNPKYIYLDSKEPVFSFQIITCKNGLFRMLERTLARELLIAPH
jgi:hypothetical protein